MMSVSLSAPIIITVTIDAELETVKLCTFVV